MDSIFSGRRGRGSTYALLEGEQMPVILKKPLKIGSGGLAVHLPAEWLTLVNAQGKVITLALTYSAESLLIRPIYDESKIQEVKL